MSLPVAVSWMGCRLLEEFVAGDAVAVIGPLAVGVKRKPIVQVEPAMIVVPQVVVWPSTMKCESEVEKGAVRLRLSVPKLLMFCRMTGELWPTMMVPKASVGFG